MTDYDKIEIVKQIIIELLEKIGVSASVEFEESITKGLIFNISTPDSYLLIGRQGATLHSLQILVQALAGRRLKSQESASPGPARSHEHEVEAGASQQGGPFWFTLDVDDYKRKREWYLKETAKAAAEQVKKTGRGVALEPMPNYERRLIHAYLQEHQPELESSSIGQEPYRKVVIRAKK